MMQRRDVLRGAVAFTVGVPTIAGTAAAYDPLIVAIDEYRAGCLAFCRYPEHETSQEEDRAIELTYGPPMERLDTWEQPALTHEGAVAALRLIQDEGLVTEGFGASLFAAALGYLETQA